MNLKMSSRIIATMGIAALLFASAACNQPNNTPKSSQTSQGQSAQPSKDELGLKDKVAASLTAAISTLSAKKITLDPANKQFIIAADSTATELSAKEIFKDANYAGMTQEFAVTSVGGSVKVANDKSKLAIKVASKPDGDSYEVKLTFKKDNKTSDFRFTVLNKKSKGFNKEQIQPKVVKLVNDLNGGNSFSWTNVHKSRYKDNGIVLPETGKIDDVDGVAFKWGLKKGKEFGARIGKNQDGKLAVMVDKAETSKVVILTVTLTKPGYRGLTLDADMDGSDATWALALTIED
ncbi:MAG: hypothetical protein ACTTH7_01725 [Treponema sp.]